MSTFWKKLQPAVEALLVIFHKDNGHLTSYLILIDSYRNIRFIEFVISRLLLLQWIQSCLTTWHGLKFFVHVRNDIKLEICLFVMNFNSRGFSLRVLYCVVDTGYGLGRSLEGNANLHFRRVKSTKWLKHKPMADLGFLFLWGSLGDGWKLSCRPLGVLPSSLAVG